MEPVKQMENELNKKTAADKEEAIKKEAEEKRRNKLKEDHEEIARARLEYQMNEEKNKNFGHWKKADTQEVYDPRNNAQIGMLTQDPTFPNKLIKDGLWHLYEHKNGVQLKGDKAYPVPDVDVSDPVQFLKEYSDVFELMRDGRGAASVSLDWDHPEDISIEAVIMLIDLADRKGLGVTLPDNVVDFLRKSKNDDYVKANNSVGRYCHQTYSSSQDIFDRVAVINAKQKFNKERANHIDTKLTSQMEKEERLADVNNNQSVDNDTKKRNYGTAISALIKAEKESAMVEKYKGKDTPEESQKFTTDEQNLAKYKALETELINLEGRQIKIEALKNQIDSRVNEVGKVLGKDFKEKGEFRTLLEKNIPGIKNIPGMKDELDELKAKACNVLIDDNGNLQGKTRAALDALLKEGSDVSLKAQDLKERLPKFIVNIPHTNEENAPELTPTEKDITKKIESLTKEIKDLDKQENKTGDEEETLKTKNEQLKTLQSIVDKSTKLLENVGKNKLDELDKKVEAAVEKAGEQRDKLINERGMKFGNR